jgi:hypothetical protein
MNVLLDEPPWSDWLLIDGKLTAETGLDNDDIAFVFALCKDDLSGFHGRKKRRSEAKTGRFTTFLSRHNLLLLALHSAWKNPTEAELEDTFETPRPTICETLERIFPILQRCLSNFIKVPAHQTKRFEAGPLAGVTFIVDSTPTPIPKPILQSDRKLYYNFKKRPSPYAIKTQVAIGLDLRIWDVSSSYPHSVHDLTVLHQTIIPGLLSDEKKGLGDSAYQGEPHFIVPYKKPRGKDLSRSQKLFNKQVAHARVTVENVFKRVKDYRIISAIYRGDYHKLDEFNCIFKVVCALVNIHFEKHPIRQKPRSVKRLPQHI